MPPLTAVPTTAVRERSPTASRCAGGWVDGPVVSPPHAATAHNKTSDRMEGRRYDIIRILGIREGEGRVPYPWNHVSSCHRQPGHPLRHPVSRERLAMHSYTSCYGQCFRSYTSTFSEHR